MGAIARMVSPGGEHGITAAVRVDAAGPLVHDLVADRPTTTTCSLWRLQASRWSDEMTRFRLDLALKMSDALGI
jgi:hypothetical protein